ncbi:MAG TPA: hypothetical protein VNG69_04270 [Casimicrobiaceae bacterium]|nr:hypothetical protein [Casimicrobiaceae bacterium]
MRDAGLPTTLIVVGLVWLAWHFRIFPDVDWIIAIGLIIGGVAVLVFDGFTKTSIVIGPFLIGVGVAWALHERYRASWTVLIPALLVWLGVLMLLSRNSRFPDRRLRNHDTTPPELPK